MTRAKKSRKAKGFIDDRGPSRKERLADPDSYDSRRRKSVEKRKKPKSVYEKHREQVESEENTNAASKGKTRLADKIRRLNEAKQESDE